MSRPHPGTPYVVTLDSDTVLPPGALHALVGVAAHPLNRPRIDAQRRRVSAGYGILQPRLVTPLPDPGQATPFHALFAGRWENRWVAAALSGLRPAVVAVVAGAALRLGRSQLRSPFAWLAAAVGAALLFAKILPPIPLILLGAAAGLALNFARRKGAASP